MRTRRRPYFTIRGRRKLDATEAFYNLGYLYENGLGVPKDAAKAASLYSQAAGKGNPSALYALGWLYHDGSGVPCDKSKAVECFLKAAELGHPLSLTSMGQACESGTGVPKTAFAPTRGTVLRSRTASSRLPGFWTPSAGKWTPGNPSEAETMLREMRQRLHGES